MIPSLSAEDRPAPHDAEPVPQIALLVREPRARRTLAAQLRHAGYRVTVAATFGTVELLLARPTAFDALVTAQSADEMAQFGLPQLARSVRPDLPIVVLELEVVEGDGVLAAVRDAILRWPVRERATPRVH